MNIANKNLPSNFLLTSSGIPSKGFGRTSRISWKKRSRTRIDRGITILLERRKIMALKSPPNVITSCRRRIPIFLRLRRGAFPEEDATSMSVKDEDGPVWLKMSLDSPRTRRNDIWRNFQCLVLPPVQKNRCSPIYSCTQSLFPTDT
jgi:hypothetical protein